MPDVSREMNAMTAAMRETLDRRGIELTHDDLYAAAMAAFTTLTEPGMILDANSVEQEVRKAIDAIRGPDPAPPPWPPHRWVNAVTHKLGEAGLAAGLILEEETATAQNVYFDRFESQMFAVAAVAQEAVISVRNLRLDSQVGT